MICSKALNRRRLTGRCGGRSPRHPRHPHLGNRKRDKLDLNADADFAGANEMDGSRTFNAAIELTARDTDTNGTANHSLTRDAAPVRERVERPLSRASLSRWAGTESALAELLRACGVLQILIPQ
ncbi:MAG: hypothetical protein ACKVZJ_10805 [Phycisphaerales bacterium]